MSIKSKFLAAAATLTLVSGVGAAGVLSAGTANAATPSCGFTCVNVFNQQFGKAFYQDVFRQGNRVNQPIILFRSADFDPALDFTVTTLINTTPPITPASVYTVAQLCAAGGTGLGAGTCLRYAGDPVWEVQYAPYGVNSGLCVGVAAAVSGEGVSLQPCGVSAKTWWIGDTAHQYFHKGHFYTPWVNGASANYTQPLVLTYPANGYPTDNPRPQLTIQTQQTFSSGAPYQNQMWGVCFGEVGISC
jgi:hypothetical protein